MARHKEFDQEIVIHKAIALFRLKGYEATSIEDLVQHLGIGRGSLYDTFGSKHQLYLLALERYLHKENTELDPTKLPIAAKELVVQMLNGQVDEAIDHVPAGGCLMVNSAMELGLHDQDVNERIKNHLKESERLFVHLLTQAQNEGDLAAEQDVHALARFLINTVVGLRVMAKINPDRQMLREMVAVALQVLG